MSMDDFLEQPNIYHIDPRIRQSDIDGDDVQWVVFPDCDDCNPNLKVLKIVGMKR